MNVEGLKKEMESKAREWAGMDDPSKFADLSIGGKVRQWLAMVNRIMDKLENPRKLREERLETMLGEARAQLTKVTDRLAEATDPSRPDDSNDLGRL